MATKPVNQRIQVTPQQTYDITTPQVKVAAAPVGQTVATPAAPGTTPLDNIVNILQKGIQSGVDTYKILAEKSYEEGKEKALLGQTPDKNSFFKKQQEEGYLEMKAKLDVATDYKRKLQDIYNNNPDATPKELQEMINKVNQKYLLGMPEVYQKSFAANAFSIENQIVDSHLQRVEQAKKQHIYDSFRVISSETAVDSVNNWLSKVTGGAFIDIKTAAVEDPDNLEAVLRNLDVNRLLTTNLRAELSTLQVNGEKLGMSKAQVSEIFVNEVGALAAKYGLPELLDFADIKDASGVPLSKTSLSSIIEKYKALAQDRREEIINYNDKQTEAQLKQLATNKKIEINLRTSDILLGLASDDPDQQQKALQDALDLRDELKNGDTIALLGEDVVSVYSKLGNAVLNYQKQLKEQGLPTDTEVTLEAKDLEHEAATATSLEDYRKVQEKANAFLEKLKNTPEYKKLSKTTISQAYDIASKIVEGENMFPDESDEDTYQDLLWKAQTGTLDDDELLSAVNSRELSKTDFRKIVETKKTVEDNAAKPDSFQVKQINNTRGSIIDLFALDPVTGALDPTVKAKIQLQHDTMYENWYNQKLAEKQPITYEAYLNEVAKPLLEAHGKSLDQLLQNSTVTNTPNVAESAFNDILTKTTEQLTKNIKLFGFIPTGLKKKPEQGTVEATAGETVTESLQNINEVVASVPPLTGDTTKDLELVGVASVQQLVNKYGLSATDPKSINIALRRANLELHGADYNGLKKRLLAANMTEQDANNYLILYGSYLGNFMKNYVIANKPLANVVDIMDAVESTLRSIGYPENLVQEITLDTLGGANSIDNIISNKFKVGE